MSNDSSITLDYIKEKIDKIIEEYRKENINKKEKYGGVTVAIKLYCNINEFYRVCAKIAFN